MLFRSKPGHGTAGHRKRRRTAGRNRPYGSETSVALRRQHRNAFRDFPGGRFCTFRHRTTFGNIFPVPFRAKYRPATQNPQTPNGRAKKRRPCRRTPSYGTASGERPEFPHRTNHGDDKQKEESRHRPVVISVSRARRPTVAKETAASKQADIAQSNASTYRSIRILDRHAAVRFSDSILNGKLWICGNRRSTVSTTSQNREAKGTPHIARRPPPSSVSPWRPKGTGI